MMKVAYNDDVAAATALVFEKLSRQYKEDH